MRHPDSFTYNQLLTKKYLGSYILSIGLLVLAFVAEHFSTLYAHIYIKRPTSLYVGDLFLDNLPVVDMNFIIIEGALWSIVASVFLVLYYPRKILFTLKTVALLITIRAFFISLTHVGIYPGQITPGDGFHDAVYMYFNFQNGYFFSGHTSMPFLMGLIFWENKYIRYGYFTLSFIFGVSVLLAHSHYSIDVLAAPFMAYGIYHIARTLFREDYKLMRGEHKVTLD